MLRGIGVAFIVVLMVGGLAGCGSTVGTTLQVGDCVNIEPSDEGESTVKVACDQAHDQEAYFSFEMPDGDFPGYFQIGDAVQDECTAAFADYVGIAWQESQYTFTFDAPTEQTWAQGERTITCLLEDNSGIQMTGSARGTAR